MNHAELVRSSYPHHSAFSSRQPTSPGRVQLPCKLLTCELTSLLCHLSSPFSLIPKEEKISCVESVPSLCEWFSHYVWFKIALATRVENNSEGQQGNYQIGFSVFIFVAKRKDHPTLDLPCWLARSPKTAIPKKSNNQVPLNAGTEVERTELIEQGNIRGLPLGPEAISPNSRH